MGVLKTKFCLIATKNCKIKTLIAHFKKRSEPQVLLMSTQMSHFNRDCRVIMLNLKAMINLYSKNDSERR